MQGRSMLFYITIFLFSLWVINCSQPSRQTIERPTGRGYFDMAYDSESDRVILFGGSTGDIQKYPHIFLNGETWAYDQADKSWQNMEPTVSPIKMMGHALAYDAQSDQVILYGGVNVTSRGKYNILNETWAYDFNTNTWKRRQDGPPGRFNHRMVYDPLTDQVILFGGVCFIDEKFTMKYFDETWLYDYDLDRWRAVKSIKKPRGRHHHGMVYNSKAGCVLLWGGRMKGNLDSSIWSLDVRTGLWTEIESSKGPDPRGYHAMAYDEESDRMIVYGGFPELSDDTWVYNYTDNTWTRVTPSENPGKLSRHCMIYSPLHHQFVLFGGQLGKRRFTYSDAVWVYKLNGDKWKDITIRRDEYFGQRKPGSSPEVFAPGIVSTEHRDHSDLLFYPNGKEIYWSVSFTQKSAAIMVIKAEGDNWASPEIASFSSPQYFDCIPSLSPDGKKLFFSSMRPVKENEQSEKLNIWQVERKGDNWSDPIPLGEVVNHPGHDSNPMLARNGNLYFGSDRQGGNGSWDIYYSEYMDGQYTQPKNLGVSINTEHIEICSYIDPDERFIVFTSYNRPGGFGSGDIYISFKNRNGEWEQALNLGKTINTKNEEAFGTFSPDKKYFFFGSNRSGNMEVYWVDAGIIEDLRSKENKKA